MNSLKELIAMIFAIDTNSCTCCVGNAEALILYTVCKVYMGIYEFCSSMLTDNKLIRISLSGQLTLRRFNSVMA